MIENVKGWVFGIGILVVTISSGVVVYTGTKAPDGCKNVVATCEVWTDAEGAAALNKSGAGVVTRGYSTLRAVALECDGGTFDVKADDKLPTADVPHFSVVAPYDCVIEQCPLNDCSSLPTTQLVADKCAYKAQDNDDCFRVTSDGGTAPLGTGNVYPSSWVTGKDCKASVCSKIAGYD